MKAIRKVRVGHGVLASAAVALCVVVLMWVRITALPTPSQFELEGNAVVDGTNPPGDDWANTVPTKTEGSEAIVSAFVADGSGNATIFTTGGSKDINDIDQWSYKDQAGGLPDKDNLTNAYAAAYAQGTDLVIYFGADRFANDGDAQIGFWFFQSQVQAVGGKFVGADGVTPAVHTVGDILVLANLTNGGAVVSAQVFKWVGGSNPLQLLANDADAKCGTNADPNVCAISNDNPEVAPWAYTPKFGTAGTFPQFSFVEGGINITSFLGGTVECFSSFLVETRSSQSPSATLKDFALGSFNTCKLDITKECPTVTFDPGTGLLTYTANITVTNSGFGPVYDLTVTDEASGGHTATLTLESLAAGASHVFTDTFTLTPGPTTPNPPTNTASVTAAPTAGGLQVISAGPVSATCPSVSFDSALTVTKTCEAGLEVQNNRIVVVVNVSGEVCNVAPDPSSGDFPEAINNIVVNDTPAFEGGQIALGNLDTGACVNYTAKYYPALLSNPTGHAGDQSFEDTVHAQGTGAITGATRQNTATANCPLCF